MICNEVGAISISKFQQEIILILRKDFQNLIGENLKRAKTRPIRYSKIKFRVCIPILTEIRIKKGSSITQDKTHGC